MGNGSVVQDTIRFLQEQSQAKYGGWARRELQRYAREQKIEGNISQEQFKQIATETRPQTMKVPDAKAQILGKAIEKQQYEKQQLQQLQQKESQVRYESLERLRPATMSKEEFASKTTTQKPLSSKVDQLKLKSAISPLSTGIPAKYDYNIQRPQIKEQKKKDVVYLEPTPSPKTKYEKRIEGLIKFQEGIYIGREKVLTSLGVKREKTDTYIKGVGKEIIGLPVNFATGLYIGGSNIVGLALAKNQPDTFVRESAILDERRVRKELPKEIISSYDIRKPEGLVNLGVTALGVREIAKGIKTSKTTTPEITVQEAVTKRIDLPQKTMDFSQVRLQAKINKKVVNVAGKSISEYINLGDNVYGLKSEGKLFIGEKKPIRIETRGIGKTTDTGFDLVSVSKTGKKSYGLDVTQTLELVGGERLSFREFTRSAKLGKKTDIYMAEPKSITVGTTTEFLKVNKLTESGKVAFSESLLKSKKTTLGQELIKKNYEVLEPRRTNILDIYKQVETKGVKPTTDINIGSGTQKTVLKTTQKTQLINLAKQELLSKTSKLKTAEVFKSTLKPISVSKVKTTEKLITKPMVQQRVSTISKSKPMTTLRPTTSIKPQLDFKSSLYTHSSTSIKPMTTLRPTTSIKPVLDIKPTFDVRPVTEIKSINDIKIDNTNEFSPKEIIGGFPLKFPPMYLFEGKKDNDYSIGKETSQYMPSVEAIVRDIKSTSIAKTSKTGLGLRPVLIKSKKRKKKR